MSAGRDGEGHGEKGFLGRWSSRKRRGDAGADRPSGTDRAARGGGATADEVPPTGAGTVSSDVAAETSRGFVPVPIGVPPDAFGGRADVGHADVGHADVGQADDGRSEVGRPDAGDAPGTGSDGDAEPLLTDADMPPIESLDASSDLSVFFGRGISATLRRAALRHVFSRPAYNVRDGLNDYDGDFTKFEPLGDTVTSDMKFHAARHERARLERERLAEEAEAEAASEAEARADEPDALAENESAEGDTRADGTVAADDARAEPDDGTADGVPADAASDDSGSPPGEADAAAGPAGGERDRGRAGGRRGGRLGDGPGDGEDDASDDASDDGSGGAEHV